VALQDLAGNDTLILLALLAIFLVVGYKVLDALKNALIIAALSAVFPFLLNRYFGTGFNTTLNSELTYVVAGVGMYFIYEILVIALRTGGIVWEIAKIAAMPIVWIYDGLKGLSDGIFGERKKSAPERKEAKKSTEDDESEIEPGKKQKIKSGK